MSKQEYKLIVLKLLKFLIIVLVVDITLGTVSQQIYFSQKTGKYARITYSIKEATAEILILGSSRAAMHYVPDVIEKKLNRTAYNCGVLGQKLIFQNALQKIILKRTKPKLIILNIDKNWLFKSEEAHELMSDLHPYYWEHQEVLKPILNLESKLIDFKLLFKSYQTNSTLIHAIKYYLSPQMEIKGYVPSYAKMEKSNSYGNNEAIVPEIVEEEIDTSFISAFKSFINTAKDENIELLLVMSPIVYKLDLSNYQSLDIMKAIAEEKQVPFLDFTNDKRFLYEHDLFRDRTHLNDDGARLFSKLLAEFINETDINRTINQ
jgi:hypothetical protein